MCGIVGSTSTTLVGAQRCQRIGDALITMALRGPDSHGLVAFGPVVLGQSRLSILDVSNAAMQPFTDPSGRFTLVFNGEIYNYRDLIGQLKNFHPVSTSDTEVLLHLYIQKGSEMLPLLNGFFAFAILDRQQNEVFVARDRMGIKPLLIHSDAHGISFASEMKALLALGIDRTMDQTALAMYLQFNYTPYPETILKGVTELEPGTWFKIPFSADENQANSAPVAGTFYSIPKPKPNQSLGYKAAQEQLHTLLTTSVQHRMIADVPLGAFLSGGVDSSIIVRIASRQTEHLRTFSIGYRDEPLFDESRHAEDVARHCGTEHTVFMLSNQDLFEDLNAVLNYIDRPFADSSALAVHILSRHTRKHVTVALSGDGADELFGGYNKHEAELRAQQPGALEKAVAALGPLWNLLPASRSSALGNKVRQLRKFAHAIGLSADERYWQWASFLPEAEAKAMLLRWTAADESTYQQRKNMLLAPLKNNGNMAHVLHTDLHQVLRNDMLTKVDLMSMANSLEVRVPFLDHTIVDFASTLPINFCIVKGDRKRILKDAFRDELPAGLFERPKHGFEVPLLGWFRNELRGVIEQDLLSDKLIREQGIFVPKRVAELCKRVMSSDPGDSATHVWNMIVFQRWWLRYFGH